MAPLIKFICESLMMELLNAYDDAPETMKQKSRRILWSMDEAGRIGIPNLPEHASTVNGRNISLSMSAQDRSQFNAVYGRDRTKNLFTNIRTQLVFCQADFETAKHYSKRTGETSGYAHSESEHEGRDDQHGKIRTGYLRDEPTGLYGNGRWGTRLFHRQEKTVSSQIHGLAAPSRSLRNDWESNPLH